MPATASRFRMTTLGLSGRFLETERGNSPCRAPGSFGSAGKGEGEGDRGSKRPGRSAGGPGRDDVGGEASENSARGREEVEAARVRLVCLAVRRSLFHV